MNNTESTSKSNEVEMRSKALEEFIESGALATNQCPNYLRDGYFRAGHKAACNQLNAQLLEKDNYIKKLESMIEHGIGWEDLKDDTRN